MSEEKKSKNSSPVSWLWIFIRMIENYGPLPLVFLFVLGMYFLTPTETKASFIKAVFNPVIVISLVALAMLISFYMIRKRVKFLQEEIDRLEEENTKLRRCLASPKEEQLNFPFNT